MKRFLPLVLIVFFFPILHGQWEFVNQHVGHYEDIQFLNEQDGWITGYNTLIKTSNGGESWQTVLLDDTIEFYQFRILTESTILAVGRPNSSGFNFIFRSGNGGESWQKGGLFPELYWYDRQLFLMSDSTYYVIGVIEVTDEIEERRIYRSFDGAESWQNITPDFNHLNLENLELVRGWFINEKTGFAVVANTKGLSYDEIMMIDVIHVFFRTTDGGETWHETYTDLNDIEMLQFINDSTGYFIAAEDSVYSFYKTTDTFRTWTAIYTLAPNQTLETYGFQSDDNITIRSTDKIYAVMGSKLEDYGPFDSLNVMCSSDGGSSWQKVQAVEFNRNWPIQFFSPFCFTENNGFFTFDINYYGYGSNISVLYKANIQDFNLHMSLLTYPISFLSFGNENTGFAGGGGGFFHGPDFGDIFKTTDGGISWELFLSREFPLGKLQFVTGNTGYVLVNGWEPGVLKTIDEGKSWNYIKSFNDTTVYRISANDMQFLDEKSGWIAGKYERYETSGNGAAIFTTSDGGESWERVWHKVSSPQAENDYWLNSVYIVNNKLWAVGNLGLVVNSDDLENFSIIDAGTELPLGNVFFKDWGHIWITGGFGNPWQEEFQSVLIRSIDNGATWETYQFSDFIIHDLYFETIHHGWAVGTDTTEKGIILETIDGGKSWKVEADKLPFSMHTLKAQKGYLWAIGDNGIILRRELENWIESAPELSGEENLILQQNFPNPFNSITNISYQLSEATNIVLSIFNTLGQRITTLDTGEKSPGTYRVEWNATGIKPGLYYYRLETGKGVSETRKLVLTE